MLADQTFLLEYRTGRNDFVQDFYQPAFDASIEYCKAVGYFSSSSLEAFGNTLKGFLQSGGKIKLITSVELQERDKKAIEDGLGLEKVYGNRINDIIENEFSKEIGDGLKRLIHLIQMDRIEIKIAIPQNRSGIYHEKVGLFFDENGDYVAFSGSKNESKNALEENYECIDVFTSWNDGDRAKLKKEQFDSLWNNSNVDNKIFTFPDASREKLIRTVKKANSKKESGSEKIDIELNKWRHQDEALSKFLEVERGLLNMATGTGKTITSIKILKNLYTNKKINIIIIATYGNSLLNQWFKEVLPLRNELGLKIFRHYSDYHDRQRFINNTNKALLICSYDNLDFVLKNLNSEQANQTLIIYDEVHRLGAESYRKKLYSLSDNIRFRLGLSATPERAYDEEGNKFIESHIGPTFYTFDLKDAIEKNILAPFNYYPLSYRLTEDEREKIKKIRALESARKKEGKPISKEDIWRMISDVYKLASEKVEVFDYFIDQHQNFLERSIIFVHNKEYAENILEIIHKYRSDFHTYFSGDDEDILKKFARSKLESLVACHRLSEGIDIRSLNNVVLFSSDRARLETIQRIGRCLRTDSNNPSKIANVVDFICEDYKADTEREEWLENLSKIRPKEINNGN